MIAHIQDEDLLNKDDIVFRLKQALEQKSPFCMVRIGDGENFVLAQDSVYTMEHTLAQLWVKEANKGRKGIKFPNIPFRDQLVKAIQEADIVGILANNDNEIRAHTSHKRYLTNKIFQHFQLEPKAVCNATVNRELLYHKPFWEMLHEQEARVVLVSRWAGGTKQRLIRPPYNLKVAFTLPFERNEMMTDTLDILEQRKDEYDIVLASCGVNAVVISHQVAKRFGKIGVDFGIASQIISYVKI